MILFSAVFNHYQSSSQSLCSYCAMMSPFKLCGCSPLLHPSCSFHQTAHSCSPLISLPVLVIRRMQSACVKDTPSKYMIFDMMIRYLTFYLSTILCTKSIIKQISYCRKANNNALSSFMPQELNGHFTVFISHKLLYLGSSGFHYISLICSDCRT